MNGNKTTGEKKTQSHKITLVSLSLSVVAQWAERDGFEVMSEHLNEGLEVCICVCR